MTGYVRVDTGNNIADGNVISAADLDNEFDGVQAAFNVSTGHTHGGAVGEGAPITKIGPTQDVTASAVLLAPKTTNTVDVGSSSLKFKDLYLAGNASIGGTLAVTGVATFTAQPVLSSLTASKAVFSDGSKGLVSNDITGTGNVVMSNSPTLVTPALGTPSSVTLTNATGLPVASGISGLAAGVATFLATPSSSNLASAVTDETGTGALVFANSPTLVTPALGTPSSATLTNATGLPVATGISGLGTGVATFLATPSSTNLASAVSDETGTGALVFANSPTLVTPALGTPASATLTNATGLPIATGVSGLGTGIATALAVNAGSAGAPVLFNGALGTPSSGTVTNLTGTASININGTVGATTPATGAFTTLTASSTATLNTLISSGATLTGGTINNMAIGGTTASTGAFTTLAASGTTTLSGNQVISVTDNTNAALRITQLGTGNALLVEDSANPDSSPFVIDATGLIVSGATTAANIGGSTVNPPRLSLYGTSGANGSDIALVNTSSSGSVAGDVRHAKAPSSGIVSNNNQLGNSRYFGYDGAAYIEAATIGAQVDGTPGLNDMPGRLVFSTTADGASSPTERMRIDSAGNTNFGTGASAAGRSVSVNKTMTGSASSYGVFTFGTVQSDVTTEAVYFRTSASTAAAAFTATNIKHYEAVQGTFGAGSTVTNQYGFIANSNIVGATNNYGFYSNIAAATGRWNFYANGTADNYFAGKVGIGDSTPSVSLDISATDAIRIPVGTTGQRPTGVNGYLRFNSTTTEFEGYNGTAWASVGGSAISNDTSTASNLFPLFASATTGTASSVFTSNAQYLFKPSTGELSVKAPRASNGIVVNSATVSSDYTIAVGDNAMSSGPVAVDSGITVTVSSGSRWVVI